MKLSPAELDLMKHLWQEEPCYLGDLLAALPEPKPAKTTVATLLKRMLDKGVIAYTQRGKSREYRSLVTKQDYFGGRMRGMISNFFGDSPTALASLFTDGADLSEEQLTELRRMIDDRLKDKK